MHRKASLTAFERGCRQRIDLLDSGIGHGVATDRDAVAVHHQIAPGSSMGSIVGVGKAEVKGEMKAAVRIHPARDDLVEPFRALAVALAQLRAEIAGIGADRKRAK